MRVVIRNSLTNHAHFIFYVYFNYLYYCFFVCLLDIIKTLYNYLKNYILKLNSGFNYIKSQFKFQRLNFIHTNGKSNLLNIIQKRWIVKFLSSYE